MSDRNDPSFVVVRCDPPDIKPPHGTIDIPPTLEIMRVSHDGENFRFVMVWTERSWQSMRICLGPKFYFYDLFARTLIIEKNKDRNMKQVIEEIQSFMDRHAFELQVELNETDGYHCIYDGRFEVELSKFFAISQIDAKQMKLKHSYQGRIRIQIVLEEETTDIDFSFMSDVNCEKPSDEVLSLNHITIGEIIFKNIGDDV